MPGARVHRLYEDAAERILEQDPSADLAMVGFPTSWREAELQVCVGPVCDCDRLRLVKDHSGIWVCIVQTSSIPALLAARLRTSNLAREGLRVVLATRKDSVHEVPKALSQHQFQAEERGALHGLRSQTELNGSPCSIVRYDQESRRWLVRLDIESEDNEILVSAANLLPLWLPEQAESLAEDKAESMPRGAESDGADAKSIAAEDKTKRSAEGPGQRKAQEADGDAEMEATPSAPASKAKAGKGTVKMSHALVVTGFPLWDLQQITQYFARFGELRTILGANKNKGGKRKLLVAYCRKVNAKKSQQHVHGAEIDGNKLSAVFADDSSFARQQEAKAAARPKNNS